MYFNKPTGCDNILKFIQIRNREISEKMDIEVFDFS